MDAFELFKSAYDSMPKINNPKQYQIICSEENYNRAVSEIESGNDNAFYMKDGKPHFMGAEIIKFTYL